MAYWTMLLLCLAGLSLLQRGSEAALPDQCNPNVISELPPRLRTACAILSRLQEMDLEEYMPGYSASTYAGINDYLTHAITGNDVKRQDIDHVFLRFGRRR